MCSSDLHWVALNGYAVSEDPAPNLHQNPWYIPDFNIYGFWLTDPAQDGIGQHVYVTAAEAQTTYFLPMDTNDTYDGKYLQVAEPPAMPPQEMMMTTMATDGISTQVQTKTVRQAKVEIVKPKPSPENLERIGRQTTFTAPRKTSSTR